MDVALPYGTQTRIVTVPDDAVVVGIGKRKLRFWAICFPVR